MTGRQHAGPPSEPQAPPIPEPTYAERARTLLHLGRVGTLSTLAHGHDGVPFGSVLPYALDGSGRPLGLISSMAVHTRNLTHDTRASLLVTQPGASGDMLAASRVTLLGTMAPVPAEERDGVRALYLARQESARYWVDFDDFAFHRLEPAAVYYVGGFGVMGWVSAEDYRSAEPDPLADAAEGILAHMNADHEDALRLLARVRAGVSAERATMTAVDRLGFHVRLVTAERVQGLRIAFPHEARTAEEVRRVLVEAVRQAREQSQAQPDS